MKRNLALIAICLIVVTLAATATIYVKCADAWADEMVYLNVTTQIRDGDGNICHEVGPHTEYQIMSTSHWGRYHSGESHTGHPDGHSTSVVGTYNVLRIYIVDSC